MHTYEASSTWTRKFRRLFPLEKKLISIGLRLCACKDRSISQGVPNTFFNVWPRGRNQRSQAISVFRGAAEHQTHATSTKEPTFELKEPTCLPIRCLQQNAVYETETVGTWGEYQDNKLGGKPNSRRPRADSELVHMQCVAQHLQRRLLP